MVLARKRTHDISYIYYYPIYLREKKKNATEDCKHSIQGMNTKKNLSWKSAFGPLFQAGVGYQAVRSIRNNDVMSPWLQACALTFLNGLKSILKLHLHFGKAKIIQAIFGLHGSLTTRFSK